LFSGIGHLASRESFHTPFGPLLSDIDRCSYKAESNIHIAFKAEAKT